MQICLKDKKMFSDDVIVIIARNKYLVYILINAKALHSFFFPWVYKHKIV